MTLVSFGLPVYNGAARLEPTVRSVLAQDHAELELLICDNASTDGTEELVRSLAAADGRIRYHRHEVNIGLVDNFTFALRHAKGTYFRWVGDDNWLVPSYTSRCLEAFAKDERLVLVTSQMEYTGPDGGRQSGGYDGDALRSDDPVVRFTELLRLLNESHLVIDPLYGLLRRAPAAAMDRRVVLHEDQILAAKLALAGPWGHIGEVLGGRGWESQSLSAVARKIGIGPWGARFATLVECREILRGLSDFPLTPEQRRRARRAVLGLYVTRHRRTVRHRSRKLLRMALNR
ncbi:glycosyltransferase family 2 protein [Nonomuraea sp. NN258]|uniref:glycosyltransferase family 2 protein n=1 Tax=Nonomuraea antri TaxID=2730852 RepID=UPI00156A23AE|nr:glycosyltransferase family 2 protein [Nonomuraea antri]NRQ32521.1 glycosyltransferase family 2 protein [Nonomuraea antri]